MTAPGNRPSVSQGKPNRLTQQELMANLEREFAEGLEAGQQEQWQTYFRSLEQWICELLIKNQQLRLALMNMQSKETLNDGDRDAVHGKGGLMFAQLWHTGRSSHISLTGGETPVSASLFGVLAMLVSAVGCMA